MALWFCISSCSPVHAQPLLIQCTRILAIMALTARFVFILRRVIVSRQGGQVFPFPCRLLDTISKQALQALCPQTMDTGWFINSWLGKIKVTNERMRHYLMELCLNYCNLHIITKASYQIEHNRVGCTASSLTTLQLKELNPDIIVLLRPLLPTAPFQHQFRAWTIHAIYIYI